MDLIFKKYETKEQQKHATAIVTSHAVMKGLQMGATFGLISGLTLGITNYFTGKGFISRVGLLKFTKWGSIIGVCASYGMFLNKWRKSIDENGMKDRAWRLQRNIGQQRLDLFSAIGLLGGMTCGAMCQKKYPHQTKAWCRIVGAGGLGVAGMVIAFFAYCAIAGRLPTKDDWSKKKK